MNNIVNQIFNTDTTKHLDDHGYFRQKTYVLFRPTVAVAIMCGSQVLLVQSSKRRDAEDGVSWLLPQGGVNQGMTMLKALSVELWQQLGLDYSVEKLEHLQFNEMLDVLGWYINPPRAEGDQPKLIVVVGVQIGELREDNLVLNDENAKATFVGSPYQLWNVMGHTRTLKLLGTLYALNQAHYRGLIQWSCESVIGQLAMTEVA